MIYFKDDTIENWLKEDVPYFDLTTHALGIENVPSKIIFTVRQEGVVCGTEEVQKLFSKLNVHTKFMLASGTKVKPQQVVLEAEGVGSSVHMGWKVALNILEYASGIATRTNRLVQLAKEGNDSIEIVTTRKVFPGTKELSIKAVLAGGGSPHRLGLSETIVVFQNHIHLLGGMNVLIKNMNQFKAKACEKRFLVEVENENDAYALCEAGADALQFDKFDLDTLKRTVQTIKTKFPHVVLVATGGINGENIREFAKTGVHAIATTAVYFGTPLDIGAKIENTAL